MNPKKLTSAQALRELYGHPPRKKMKLVFTNGCFDILHAGHVSYLEEARTLGDTLIVGLNSDESIQIIKGPKRPITPLHHRLRVLAALSCVDWIVPFSEDTPYEIIKVIVPDILVKGGDWQPQQIIGNDVVKKSGGQVLSIPLVSGLSTTNIIQKIKEAY